MAGEDLAAGFFGIKPKVLGSSFFLATGFFLGSGSESSERKSVIFFGTVFLAAGFLAGAFFAGAGLAGETVSSEELFHDRVVSIVVL